MLKVISVVCHVVAGFVLTVACVLSFISGIPAMAKLLMLGGTALPGVIALVIGLACTRFRLWKRDTGVVLLSATVCNVVMVVSIACMLMSEEMMLMFPESASMPFRDYVTGILVMAVLAIAGWLLFQRGDAERQQSEIGKSAIELS